MLSPNLERCSLQRLATVLTLPPPGRICPVELSRVADDQILDRLIPDVRAFFWQSIALEVRPGEQPAVRTPSPANRITEMVKILILWQPTGTVSPLEPDQIGDDDIAGRACQIGRQVGIVRHSYP
jgi:hypothetical protein